RKAERVSSEDVDLALDAAEKVGAPAVLVLGGPPLLEQKDYLAQATIARQLPAMYGRAEFVEAGGLMAYAVTLDSLYARSATLVARLLEGAAVADVPW